MTYLSFKRGHLARYQLVARLTAGSLLVLKSAWLWSQPITPLDNKASLGQWGIETQYISKTILPGDDFYHYVNEGWLKSTPLPAGSSVFGSFNYAAQKNQERIASLIQDAAHSNAIGPMQLIDQLYAGYLDTTHIDQLGIEPIKQDIMAILSLKDYQHVAQWMAKPGATSIVTIHAGPDPGNRSRFLVWLSESGLGLPSPDWYQKTESPFLDARKAYLVYITKVLDLAGINEASQRATDILALETKLAALQWTPVQLRESKNARVMSTAQLVDYAPGFPWTIFLAARNVATPNEIFLQTDTPLKAKAELFSRTPVSVWSSYLAFHWIASYSFLLPEAFRKSYYNFYSTTLNGVKTISPREKRAVNYTNSRLSNLIGKLYVERYFPASYLTKIQAMVSYVRRAFAERLATLAWLDDTTRKEALTKLNAVTVRIGYPQQWRDYSSLRLDAKNPVQNEQRVLQADWEYERSLLTRAFTSNDWYQAPQTVDATSSKLYNSIEFPAGLLQPPFFDPFADPAVNFGAIGAIIGHELGHCFDDQGSQFDAYGVKRDWWTTQTRNAFDERSARLVTQYDSYSPIDSLHVNGKQTIGENIGDLTGVVVAHQAYKLYLDDHPGSSPVLDGFTGDQRYFLSWAQVWRCLYTPASLRNAIAQGYHSPAQYRVNGVVSNIDSWYAAFGVLPQQKLYLPPTKRVRIW